MNDNGSAGRTAGPRISGVGESGILLVFHLSLLLITIAPILSVEILPLGDFPNHMARLHILANLDAVPALQQNYEIVPTLTPYLLVDWMLTPLTRIWSVYDVGRGFVAATMAMTYGGILALGVTFFSRLTVWPALALPILYNYAFSWGFMNFSFGVGLMFWALALWLHLRHRGAWVRLAVLLILSAALYLTHMLAFGIFALLVGGHSLSVAWRQKGPTAGAVFRELVSVVPPFVLTLSVYAFWLANDAIVGEKITSYGSIIDKSAMVVSPTMFSDSLADWALLSVYLISVLYLAARGKVLFAENTVVPLIFFAVICLIMPNTLMGVWGVDFRLPPVLLMFLIAVTQPEILTARPAQPAVMAVVTALVLVRAVSLWPQLQLADRQFLEFKNATHEIDEGSRVLVSNDLIRGAHALSIRAFLHLQLIAVIERNVFAPELFTGITQVRPTARNRDIDAGAGPVLRSKDIVMGLEPGFISRYRNRTFDAYSRVYWADWPKNFDYLVRINPKTLDDRIAAELESITRYSFFEIAKVRK